jgi:hypothetical protein
LDRPVFAASGGMISGHSLKHLAAAAATWWVLAMLRAREPVKSFSKSSS